MKVKSEREVAQSCLTLCDPTDCSLPGSSVHGIFQARVLECGASQCFLPIWTCEHERWKNNSYWIQFLLLSRQLWVKTTESGVVTIPLCKSCCCFPWGFPGAGSGTLEREEVRKGKKCPKGFVMYWKELESSSQKILSQILTLTLLPGTLGQVTFTVYKKRSWTRWCKGSHSPQTTYCISGGEGPCNVFVSPTSSTMPGT